MGNGSRLDDAEWVYVVNDDETPVPPFAVMESADRDLDADGNGTGFFKVIRPTGDSLTEVFVNGPMPIVPGGRGQGTRSEPREVLVETADGAPEVGDDYGTAAGSWKLHKGNTGFRVIGVGDDANTAEMTFLGASYRELAAGPCDLAGLESTDCLKAVGPSNTVYLEYAAGGPADALYLTRNDPGDAAAIDINYPDAKWVSTADLEYPNEDDSPGPLVFWFQGGSLHLSLDGKELLHCGNGCFRGGALTGHVIEGGVSCAGSTFQVCLTCECCPIAGWDGPGWYCVEDTGPEDCMVAYLEEADRCANDIVICSGPYASEAIAEAVCGTPAAVPCPCGGSAGNWHVVDSAVFSDQTGEATCLTEFQGIITGPLNHPSSGNTITCEGNITFNLACTGGEYVLTITGGIAGSVSTTLVSCTSSVLTFDVTIPAGLLATGGTGGTALLTFTGTFP